MGQVLALGGVVGDEWGSRAIAVFGHRPYVGVSANVVAAGQLPGWDEREIVPSRLGGCTGRSACAVGSPPLTAGLLGSVAKAVIAAAVAGPVAPSAGPTPRPTSRPRRPNTWTPRS